MMFFWQNSYLENQHHNREILEGLARGPYAIWWANRAEERGESLSGVDIYEAAPRTPSRAKKWARSVANEIDRLNNRSLDGLYDLARSYGYPHDRERFGSDLGLQVTGEGVSWTDDVPGTPPRGGREGIILLPHAEFYL